MNPITYLYIINANIMKSQCNPIGEPNSWISPATKIKPGADVISMAQYYNVHGRPPQGMRVEVERSVKKWEQASVIDVDTDRDSKDPHNYGYWHGSKVHVRFDDGVYRWMPFSMILVKIK